MPRTRKLATARLVDHGRMIDTGTPHSEYRGGVDRLITRPPGLP